MSQTVSRVCRGEISGSQDSLASRATSLKNVFHLGGIREEMIQGKSDLRRIFLSTGLGENEERAEEAHLLKKWPDL